MTWRRPGRVVRFGALVLTLGMVWAFSGSPTMAAEAHRRVAGAIRIADAWIRATPPGAASAAAYLRVINTGKAPDRLVGADIAGVASVTPHEMSMNQGVMRMRELPNGVPTPAHGEVALSPGGDHLMLMGLGRGFHVGETIPATLRFAHAGKIRAMFVVRESAPTAP